MFRRHRLTAFIIKAVLSVIGLALVWPFIAPYYDRILIAVADGMVMPSLRFASYAGNIYGSTSAGQPIMGIHGAALHFSLILLLALLIATPGLKIINRLRNIGIGLAVMFVFHLVILTVLARLMPSGGGTATPSLRIPMVLLSTIGLNLFPALVWVGLCLRQWLAGEFKKRNMAPETPPSVNTT